MFEIRCWFFAGTFKVKVCTGAVASLTEEYQSYGWNRDTVYLNDTPFNIQSTSGFVIHTSAAFNFLRASFSAQICICYGVLFTYLKWHSFCLKRFACPPPWISSKQKAKGTSYHHWPKGNCPFTQPNTKLIRRIIKRLVLFRRCRFHTHTHTHTHTNQLPHTHTNTESG